MFFTYIKKVTILFFILVLTGCSLKDFQKLEKEEKKEKPLIKEAINPHLIMSINEIITLIKKHDIKAINDKYINKKYGFFDIYKSKNIIKYKKNFTINVLQKEYFSFPQLIKRASFKLEPLKNTYANFYCSPHDDTYYGWDKNGLFYTGEIKFPKMQELIQKNKDFNEKFFAKLIDITSYRVVLSEAEIIFFLSKDRSGDWFISLFDRASISCSSK